MACLRPEGRSEMKMVFLDTETTGLDVTRHEVWEFGAIVVPSIEQLDLIEHAQIVWEPTWLEMADPGAIRVNHYYRRTRGMEPAEDGLDLTGATFSDPYEAAKFIAWLCEDAIIVGNNPGFDEKFLEKFCRDQSQVFAGFHRKLNIVDMALGALKAEEAHLLNYGDSDGRLEDIRSAVSMPHSSRKVVDAAGCPPNQDPHTALGDARHVYDAFCHLWGW